MKILVFVLIVATQFARVGYCQDIPTRTALRQDKAMQTASEEGFSAEKAPGEQTAIDFDYAWDQFYHRSRLIWECRGVQSGKFVPLEFCAFKEKHDTQWPDKKIPGHWKPQ
jgi:hypothetical protein